MRPSASLEGRASESIPESLREDGYGSFEAYEDRTEHELVELKLT